MTIKKKDSASDKKSRVKVGKLRVNKEIVEDLTDKEAEQIKGGAISYHCGETVPYKADRKAGGSTTCDCF